MNVVVEAGGIGVIGGCFSAASALIPSPQALHADTHRCTRFAWKSRGMPACSVRRGCGVAWGTQGGCVLYVSWH